MVYQDHTGEYKLLKIIMFLLLGLGGIICCLNFYLMFIRFSLHRFRGGTKDNFQWISCKPIIGSALVAVSLFEFWDQSWLGYLAVVLILIDTGGLHWFLGLMIYQRFSTR